MDRRLWHSIWFIYLAFVIAFPLGMAWVETHELTGPTICFFRLATCLDCPSCGMTRAFRAMGRLDVVGAFRYNPLGPAVFLGVVVVWCYCIALLATDGRITLPPGWLRIRQVVLKSAFVLLLAVGVARMVYEIHHPPAPPHYPAFMTKFLR